MGPWESVPAARGAAREAGAQAGERQQRDLAAVPWRAGAYPRHSILPELLKVLQLRPGEGRSASS
jgi:hypothetical protein